jgi:hypothetical protein
MRAGSGIGKRASPGKGKFFLFAVVEAFHYRADRVYLIGDHPLMDCLANDNPSNAGFATPGYCFRFAL